MDKELTLRERLACRIMGDLKYNEKTMQFYKCRENDFILNVASRLLKRDPIKFAIDLTGISEKEIEESGLNNLV